MGILWHKVWPKVWIFIVAVTIQLFSLFPHCPCSYTMVYNYPLLRTYIIQYKINKCGWEGWEG